MQNEKAIEKTLRDRVKQCGGIAYKFVSPSLKGVPDRIVVLPRGFTAFVETKAGNNSLSPSQRREKKRITELGAKYYLVRTRQDIEKIIADWWIKYSEV